MSYLFASLKNPPPLNQLHPILPPLLCESFAKREFKNLDPEIHAAFNRYEISKRSQT